MKPMMIMFVALGIVGVFFVMQPTTALAAGRTGVIVVDMQGDFTTWKNGSLAVKGTDQAFVNRVKETTAALSQKGYLIFATQDWHPADHVSFAANHSGKKPFDVIRIDNRTQVLWPVHCVQGTANARILVDNNLFQAVVQKGRDPRFDSYSGFQDDGGAKTGMTEILKRNHIQDVIVYGIATDYCVKATAVDAADAGFHVTVVEGLCHGVAPDTTAEALKEMEAKGIRIVKELDL